MKARFEFSPPHASSSAARSMTPAPLQRICRRALVVTRRNARAPSAAENSPRCRRGTRRFCRRGEPVLDTVERGTKLAQAEHCELVIGFARQRAGRAKAIAAMLTNKAVARLR